MSFPPELAARVRAEAEAEGKSLSGWLADAATRKLRRVAERAVLAEVRMQWPGCP